MLPKPINIKDYGDSKFDKRKPALWTPGTRQGLRLLLEPIKWNPQFNKGEPSWSLVLWPNYIALLLRGKAGNCYYWLKWFRLSLELEKSTTKDNRRSSCNSLFCNRRLADNCPTFTYLVTSTEDRSFLNNEINIGNSWGYWNAEVNKSQPSRVNLVQRTGYISLLVEPIEAGDNWWLAGNFPT